MFFVENVHFKCSKILITIIMFSNWKLLLYLIMNWKVLKTEEEYNKAAMRMMELFHSEPNTPENDELDLLIVLHKDYDEKH